MEALGFQRPVFESQLRWGVTPGQSLTLSVSICEIGLISPPHQGSCEGARRKEL